MVNVRIYRATLAIVFVAVVVFGFSLQDSPGADSTALAPGQFFGSAYATAQRLATTYGAPAPGSAKDTALAGYVASSLHHWGMTTSTTTEVARTAAGEQALETVVGEHPGLGTGTIAIVAPRDAPGALSGGRPSPSTTAGTAVLLDLAHAISGNTLNHTVKLISVSGSVGNAGMKQLICNLGSDVDAVIVLGDLANANIGQPVVLSWSDSDLLAPETLTETVQNYVHAQTGIAPAGSGLLTQFAHFAFPFSVTGQAPFARAGIPAVAVSLSGQRLPGGQEPTDPVRPSQIGMAVLQSLNALDQSPDMGPPSTYLSVSSQQIPAWAIRLLALGLIAPVALTLVDALARSRRRGHSVASWAVWVLSAAIPFLVGWLVLVIAGASHVLASAPPGAAAGGVPFKPAGAAVIVVVLAAVALSFRFLRPLGVSLATSIGWRRTPTTPPIDGAVVALAVVLCLLALVIWLANPFAALLLVPALHLWMWLASPALRHRWQMAVLICAGLLGPVLVLLYYGLSLGLEPWSIFWSVVLLVAGGGMSAAAGVAWCVALGTLASGVVLAVRAAGSTAPEELRVTVRGPVSYAGPGSLGGTKSALRR